MRIIPYALPPLLGAAIGYVTNYLAIRMLFRPLSEKRILGVRVPFTPGIIPRQRYQLSQSIARMVSTRLLTSDAVHAKITEPGFEKSLKLSVSRFTADVLDGAPARDDSSRESSTATELVATLVRGFVQSDAFRDAATRIVRAAVRGVLGLEVRAVTPSPESIDRLIARVLDSISGGPAGEAVRAAARRWVERHIELNTPLHEVLGPKTLSSVSELLPRSYAPILDSVLVFLRRPDTRRELALHGRDLLKRILKRLSVVQRLLVSATQYDRNLSENMPAIVGDVIDTLETAGRNPDNRDRIVEVFRSKLSEWGETGVATLAASLAIDPVKRADEIAARGLELLGRDDTREKAVEAVGRFLEVRADSSVAELLEQATGLDPEDAEERILRVVDDWLSQPESAGRIADQIAGFLSSQLGAAGGLNLRRMVVLGDEQKDRIDGILAGYLSSQLEKRVPELVESLDVYGMVVQKIDSLDVESVEQLLLMVISKHLKWINLFGAILGALIGGIQVLTTALS